MDWASYAREYLADLDSPYHRNRFAMVDRLLHEQDVSAVVDFGCGDGRVLRRAVKGFGIDISEEMVSQARSDFHQRYLEQSPSIDFAVGGVDVLCELDSEAYSLVMAINALAYLSIEECLSFYKEAHRILQAQGTLVVTHSNELFDMFTLNRYTRSFYIKHFDIDISSLLTFPSEPDRRPHPIRANPLNFGTMMSRYGFKEVQQEFAIPHESPPLLLSDFNPDDLKSRQIPESLDVPPEDRWKDVFRCSIFGSRLTKVAID